MGIQGDTRGYRGLQGVTGGYKGLQGVTWGYKGLQGMTGGDKALQEVTNDYRNFFLTRTFPHTFSWSILLKIKVEEILKFLPKQWTNPFAKMPILWVLKPMFFLFSKACLLYKTSKIFFLRFIFTIYDI